MKTLIRYAGKLAVVILATLGLTGCQSGKSGCATCNQCCSAAPTKENPTAPAAKAKPTPTTPIPAATAPVVTSDDEVPLFDGKTMKGWKVTDFAGVGEVVVTNGQIIMYEGVMTGVNYTNPLPTMNYEINYDACRIAGSDFFATVTFPVGDSHTSLVVGGWGGGLVGISSVDGMDASENDTTKVMNFDNGKWYHITVAVRNNKIEAWIDDVQVVNLDTRDKKLTVRPGEIESSIPFGFATWASGGALKNITLRKLK